MKKFLGILFCIFSVFLQPMRSFPVGSFRTYLVNNGLSNSTVWCGIQDKWGFMWFGTGNGLNRFDGYEFRTYKDSVRCATNNMDIHTICEENDTLWWIGHELGISLFDVNKETFLPFPSGQIDVRVHKIIKDKKNDLIWIATRGKGIYRYHCKTQQLIPIPCISDIVWDLTLDEQGNLYAATHQKGLASYTKEGKLRFFSSNTPLHEFYISDHEVKSLFYEKGVLWAGTWQGGLNRIDLKQKKTTSFFTPKDPLYIPHLRTMAPYGENELLLGTDEGVYVFNRNTQKVYSLDKGRIPGLSDPAVHSITVDRMGGIWMGTMIGGITYQPFLRKKIETYTPYRNKMGFSGKIVTDFQEDPKGNLWIATEDGGLNYFDPQQEKVQIFLPQKNKNSLSYHNIRSLLLDGDHLWIGTFSKGLDRLNLKTGLFTNYQNVKEDTTSLSDNSAYVIFKHSKGDVFIGTVWGLNQYNPSTNSFIRIPEIGKETQINDIREDEEGNLWIATYKNGVFCYLWEKKQWVNYAMEAQGSELTSNMTISLFIDHAQRLWVGTYGAGLCLLDKQKNCFRPFKSDKRLKNATIYSIEEDPAGNLWIGSDKGLFRIKPESPENIQVFTKEDGLQEDQYYPNSVLKTRKGKIYFGGINGFSSFYPEEMKVNPHSPEVQITSFQIYNNPIPAAPGSILPENIVFVDTVELSHSQNMIGFSFSALDYEVPEKNQYAYLLEGVDESWIYTHKPSVSYANLQPGTYVFRLKAANNDGLWGNKERKITILIHPPFWKSTPAYVLYVLLILFFVLFFLRIWYVRIQHKNKLRIKHLKQEKEKEINEHKLTFFTQIAHDIRTPLSLIKGPLEEVLNSKEDKAFTEKMLQTMNKNVDYLVRLVDQLLLFRKIENKGLEIVLEVCDVKSTLSGICDYFQANAELKKISFSLQLTDSPVYARLDRSAFDKIVSNLLFNAFKFTKDRICVELITQNNQLELRISDNGRGVPASMHSQIFTPFYSSDNKNGIGIGLALAKELAEKLHGTIRVTESEEGGACFILQLPLYKKTYETAPLERRDAKETDANDLPSEQGKSGKYTLLVVEDNSEVREFIVSLIEKQGYLVYQAEEGEEAISILKTEIIHLIISDIMMPGMNGLDLCTFVKQDKALCYIPFILLTAKTSEESHIQGLKQGADAYLYKPFSGKMLLTQVENLLQNRIRLYQSYLSTPFSKIDSLALNKQDKLFIEELNKKIDEKLRNEEANFSIDNLAGELGMSRSVLYRRIKGTFNLSPNDYLKSCKLKLAANWLKNEGMRINEVADRLGFSSSSYFARCFKEQFGMTPKEFMQESK